MNFSKRNVFPGWTAGIFARTLIFSFLVVVSLALAGCGDELSEDEARSLAGGGSSSATPDPASTSVLILMDETPAINNSVTALTPFGFATLDTFDTTGSTPTLATLQGYDVVLFEAVGTALNEVGTGDAVGNYVDAGGSVVMTTLSFGSVGSGFGARGLITTNGQSPYNFDATVALGVGTLGTIFDSGHFIMTGVTTAAANTRDDPTLAAGATLLADWADGNLFVAVNSNGRVVGITAYMRDWSAGAGDFDQLLANAIAYVAVQ